MTPGAWGCCPAMRRGQGGSGDMGAVARRFTRHHHTQTRHTHTPAHPDSFIHHVGVSLSYQHYLSLLHQTPITDSLSKTNIYRPKVIYSSKFHVKVNFSANQRRCINNLLTFVIIKATMPVENKHVKKVLLK